MLAEMNVADKLALADSDNVKLLRWVVTRGTECMCLSDTQRTTVQGYRHRLITRGPPVRVGLHRLSRPGQELVDKALQEDVARGQLVNGLLAVGLPGLPHEGRRSL